MSYKYTEMVENNYPGYMKEHWQEHKQYLERELRKAKVKIAELEKKIESIDKKPEEIASD